MLYNIKAGDSGALCHYCNSDEGLFQKRIISEKRTIDNRKTMGTIKIGSLLRDIAQRDGKPFRIRLREVKLVPELWINLCSLNNTLWNEIRIRCNGLIIQFKEGTARTPKPSRI
jgi:hypothetical protein